MSISLMAAPGFTLLTMNLMPSPTFTSLKTFFDTGTEVLQSSFRVMAGPLYTMVSTISDAGVSVTCIIL